MKTMMYIIDSADTEKIKRCVEFFPVAGVTTNPTIISKEKADFVQLVKTIRDIIGPERMFHIQTTADTAEDMIREAQALKELVGGNSVSYTHLDVYKRQFTAQSISS